MLHNIKKHNKNGQNLFPIGFIFNLTIKTTKEYDPTRRNAFFVDGKYGSDFLVTGLTLKQKEIIVTIAKIR